MASIPHNTPHVTAIDAINPAFSRTFTLLVKPFHPGAFLKRTIIAGIAEISYLGMILGLPLQIIQVLVMTRVPQQSSTAAHAHSSLVMGIMIAIFGCIGLAVMTFLLYFFCRLRFVVLDLVLFGQDSISAAWRKYGRPTWRYFGLTLLLSLGVLLLVAIVAGPMIPAEMRITRSMDPTRPMPIQSFLGVMMPYLGLMMGLGLLIYIVDGIVRDLFLPPMGLADAPIERCFRRSRDLFRTEPGDSLLYVTLRTVLGIVCQWAATFAVLIPILFIAGIGALTGVLLYRSLWPLGPGGQLLFVAFIATGAFVVLVLYVGGTLAALGCAGIFKQTYAVAWLSTRYPELSTILYGAREINETTPQESPLPPTPPPDIAPPLLG
jgi:hypothetical protein